MVRGPTAAFFKRAQKLEKARAVKARQKARGPPIEFFKKAREQEKEREKRILAASRATSVKRQTTRGVITVTVTGLVTIRDRAGRLIERFQTTPAQAKRFVALESFKLSERARVVTRVQRQEVERQRLLKTLGTIRARTVSIPTGTLTVTKGGLVTRRDLRGKQVDQFRTTTKAAVSFIRAPKQIPKVSPADIAKITQKQETFSPAAQAALRKAEQKALVAVTGKKTKAELVAGTIFQPTVKPFVKPKVTSLGNIHATLEGLNVRAKIEANAIKGLRADNLRTTYNKIGNVLRSQAIIAAISLAKGGISAFNLALNPFTKVAEAKGLFRAFSKPLETLGAIAREFAINPVGLVAEFIGFSKTFNFITIGVIKPSAKKLANTVRENVFIASLPSRISAQARKILNLPIVKKTINKGAKFKTADLIEIRTMKALEIKALRKAELQTTTIGLVSKTKRLKRFSLATTKSSDLFNKLIKNLPQNLRSNYIIRQGRLISKLDNRILLISRTIKQAIRPRSFQALTNSRFFKAATRKIKIKRKPLVAPRTINELIRKRLGISAKKVRTRFLKSQTGISSVQLQKEIRILQRQLALQRKLDKGIQIKVLRTDFVIKNGKKVFPFLDKKTGNVRFFTSRKLWLKAIRAQVKLIPKVEPQLASFLKRLEVGPKVSKKILARATRISSKQLAKEIRNLRRQIAIESKLKRGLQVKALRTDFIILGGKKLFRFLDKKTGRLRDFTSRRKWLKAIKAQTKALPKVEPEFAAFFRRVERVQRFKKGFRVLDEKGKLLIEIKEVPKLKPKIKPKLPPTLPKKLPPGFREVRTRTGQVLIQKTVTVQKTLKKLKTKQATLTKQITRIKQRLVPVSRVKTASQANTFLQLSRSLLALSSLLSKQQKQLSIQKSLTKQLAATKQITRQKQKQLQKQVTDQVKKIREKQIQITIQITKQKQIQKQIQKVKLIAKRRAKLIEIPKPVSIIKTKLQRRKIKKLKKVIKKAISKQKFIYIPDLFSIVFGIKANLKEKAALLKKGRVFKGITIRKLV